MALHSYFLFIKWQDWTKRSVKSLQLSSPKSVLSLLPISFSSRERNILLTLSWTYTVLPSSSPTLFLLLPNLIVYQTCLLDSCLSSFPTLKKKKKTQNWAEELWPQSVMCPGRKGMSDVSVSGIEVGQETGSSVYASFTRRVVGYCAWKLSFLFKI